MDRATRSDRITARADRAWPADTLARARSGSRRADRSAQGGDTTESGGATDWLGIALRAREGDRRAYAALVRLVTAHLRRWRAFDFASDWEDIIQEVLLSTLAAHRDDRFASAGALAAYVRQATRFKFIDRVRAENRSPLEPQGDGDPAALHWPPPTPLEARAQELRLSIVAALGALPERERRAVEEVHVRGRTYEEAARHTGIPLGTLKRALREGLARLRDVLEDS